MSSKIGAGSIAGVLAGIAFGIMMQMMTAPTPQGEHVPMMMMVAMVVRSKSIVVGWLYHLFNSAVIGAIFGWLIGNRVTGYGNGAAWGAAYGIVWWVIGALILMPILLGMPAFAPLVMPPMRSVAMGSLVGHLMFGVILGLAYHKLTAGAQSKFAQESALGSKYPSR
jgi:hypothetical protein